MVVVMGSSCVSKTDAYFRRTTENVKQGRVQMLSLFSHFHGGNLNKSPG